jgi:hypothetical protein
MSQDIPEVENILSQLKSLPTAKKQMDTTPNLTPEQLEQFVIDKTADLVTKSMEILDEYRDFLTATPGEESAAAMAELINASNGAIETLSKIAVSNKKINTTIKIKDMEIQARKEIAKDDNNTKLLMSRQDLMKLLKDADAAIDAESVVVSEQSF